MDVLSLLATLTLVNLSDTPLKGIAIPLNAERVYKVLGLDIGTPVEILDHKGKLLPCQFDEKAGILWVVADLPGMGKSSVKIRRSERWPEIKGIKATWDPKEKKGEVSNSFITVKLNGETASVTLPDGRTVFERLHFFGWLTEERIHVPNPRWASEKGIPRLSTTKFKSLKVEIPTCGPVRCEIKLTKEGEVEGIVYHERFILHSWRPIVEYWLGIENRKEKEVYIADCDGIIHARWGQAMGGSKTIQVSKGGQFPVTDDWACVSESDLPVMFRSSDGTSVALINLSPHTYNWCYTTYGFWLYQSGMKGERPIPIPPYGKASFGVAFITSQTGILNLVELNKEFSFPLPVSAFLNGEPIHGGGLFCLREDFLRPERWLCKGGRIERGGKFICETESANAVCALKFVKPGPKVLRLDVEKVKGKLEVEARTFIGERIFSTRVDKLGKQEWEFEAKGEIALEMRLSGKGSEATFKSLYLGPPPLPAPKLVSPPPGMEITDIASFFTWKSVKEAERYEVQLSRTRDFKKPFSFEAPELKANVAAFFPEKPLSEGKWFWRVRAFLEGGVEGEWSEVRNFTINSSHPRKPVLRPVSRERPLFIFHSPSEIDKAWLDLPEDLRSYCALRVEVAERGLDFFEFCRTAEKAGANVIIQCSGPRGGVYREVYNGRYGRQCLSSLEWAFQNFPHIIGVTIVEQFFHFFTDPTSKEYVKRLIKLCAKYGRLLIFADGHWVRRAWLKLGSDPEMMRLLREHKEYVIPLWKMNCGFEPLTIHGSVLGLWVCGIVEKFGVEPEDWFWFEAGFRGLGEKLGIGGGNREMCPPTFWGQMMLLELTGGATCWCLEPSWGMWEKGKPGKMREDNFIRVVAPLMRAIVKHRLIPERKEVLSNIKVACKVEEVKLKTHFEFGPLETLFLGTYGLRHQSEMIPNTGRYYFIPLLPPLCEEMPKGLMSFKTSEFVKPEEVREFFNRLYPPFYEGEAFVVKVGKLIVVMNSHENEDVTERFEVPVESEIVKSLTGEIAPHGYILAKNEGKSLWLHINGRLERRTSLSIKATRRLKVKSFPAESLTFQWNEETKTLSLLLSHERGAVEIVLED